jgi:hypothetical protein
MRMSKRTRKFKKETYLGISSSSSPGEVLALCFQLATLGFFEWLGIRSPPEELIPSWEVLVLLPFIISAKVRLSSVPSSSYPLTGSTVG